MNRRSIEQFIVSRRNLNGTVLGLGGLGLFLAGVTTWPAWLPITAAMYAIGLLVTPAEAKVRLDLGGGEDASDIKAGLDALVRQIRGRVADDIAAKVASIRDGILATLSTDAAASGAERDLFLIRQTALDYLPNALNAYLAIPRRYAERRAVVGSRTPHEVLLEQLQLMDEKMSEVADDIARHDTDRLLAHGRFLRDKFSGSALDLDTATVAPATSERAASSAASTPASSPEHDRERERVH